MEEKYYCFLLFYGIISYKLMVLIKLCTRNLDICLFFEFFVLVVEATNYSNKNFFYLNGKRRLLQAHSRQNTRLNATRTAKYLKINIYLDFSI